MKDIGDDYEQREWEEVMQDKLDAALARAEFAERMAALWKLLAGIKYPEAELYKESARLERSCVMQLAAELAALKDENAALRLDCVGTMIGQRELHLTNQNAVLTSMVSGLQSELAALKKDARICAEVVYEATCGDVHIRRECQEVYAMRRILEATKGSDHADQ